MTFEIDSKDFEKKLGEIFSTENFVEGIKQGCLAVEATAREKAPKDTGALRRSIETNVNVNGDKIVGVVSTPLEYAPYIEFGTGLFAEDGDGRKTAWSYQDDEGKWHTTSGMRPQPFMRPALTENKQNIINSIMEALTND